LRISVAAAVAVAVAVAVVAEVHQLYLWIHPGFNPDEVLLQRVLYDPSS
jgi:hypothetical protein